MEESDFQREPIPTNDDWLSHFQWWLDNRSNVKDVYTKRKYIRAITGLVNGEGIPYPKDNKFNYPTNVVFHAGNGFRTLAEFMEQDFGQMKDDAKEHERNHGPDRSKGNLFQHPISRLQDYQKYIKMKCNKHTKKRKYGRTIVRENSQEPV